MARKRARTITMSDEVFDGLKAVALYRNYKGSKTVSVSSILEELAVEFLSRHADDVAVIQSGLKAMENEVIQLNLFNDNDGTSAK